MPRTLLAAFAFLSAAFVLGDEPAKREAIGSSLGKTIYRDQLTPAFEGESPRDQAFRLFVSPATEKYLEDHAEELTPTKEQIDQTHAATVAIHEKRIASEEPALRERVAEIERKLKQADLDAPTREALEREKGSLEVHLTPPSRDAARFILTQWMFQKHLYDKYGGGRLLFQQFGTEAFDATRKWMEDLEGKGEFRVDDPVVRDEIYFYWTKQNHGPFIMEDPESIRTGFVEPAWAPESLKRPKAAP